MTVVKLDVLLFLLFCVTIESAFAARVYYEKCDYKGFSCTKSTKLPGKYDVAFVCNSFTTSDVEFYLWQFRAPSTITSFTIANCTNVRVNMVCTGEGRPIQSLKISNVTKLSFTSFQNSLSHTPPELIIEDVEEIEEISSRMFIQIKKFPVAKYSCYNPLKDFESVTLRNVRIGSIEREAFHNLTGMKNFTFQNVSVEKIHAAAIQVFMDKNTEFVLTGCRIGVMEYLSMFIRGNKLVLNGNSIEELYTSGINATIFDLQILNNSIGWMHSRAILVLAQHVVISDNTFAHVTTGAFQGIGPGLPENSLRGFGSLKFTYSFQSNLVESLDVASLHPDYSAYKNVGSMIKFTYNAIKCTCSDLKWLGINDGFGRHYSALVEFYSDVMRLENNNICSDAPCILPLDTVRLLSIKNQRCLTNITQEYMCSVYHSTTQSPSVKSNKSNNLKTSTLMTTSVPLYKKINTINNNPVLYQRRVSFKSYGILLKCSYSIIIILMMILYTLH